MLWYTNRQGAATGSLSGKDRAEGELHGTEANLQAVLTAGIRRKGL